MGQVFLDTFGLLGLDMLDPATADLVRSKVEQLDRVFRQMDRELVDSAPALFRLITPSWHRRQKRRARYTRSRGFVRPRLRKSR